MLLLKKLYGIDERAFHNRDPKFKETDAAVARAIAQAACEVELFTIPLYMTALYSIQGFHQINSSGNDFYAGRQWPGAATAAEPRTANDKAFNLIFSVFVEEMLHLQLAANMATTIGRIPSFTNSSLQNANHGWTCYGPSLSVIPHIIDLKDTRDFDHVAVNIGPLSRETIDLFIAIEQPEKEAERYLKNDVPRDKYFPSKPLDKWGYGAKLPMFGTIGYMYQYYAAYLQMTYKGGTRLWDTLFNQPTAQQNDMFNSFVAGGHPMREYPGFEATIAQVYPDVALQQMLDMMDAICDQGEGGTLNFKAKKLGLKAAEVRDVKAAYRSNFVALESDYPSYDQQGALRPSADAEARFRNDEKSHYDRFIELKSELLQKVVTWPDYLERHPKWAPEDFEYRPRSGKSAKAATAKTATKAGASSPLPTTKQTADAMNALKQQSGVHTKLSQAVVGAIAGVTTVLDDYWNAVAQKKSPVSFPMPSMVGSGDRMAICWAVTGKTPDLATGLAPPDDATLYHACQGLAWDSDGKTANDCAAVAIFHTCRGSNGCHAQGGCGFAQAFGGGGSCGSSSSCGTATMLRGTAGYMRRIGEPKMKLMGGMCGSNQAPGYQPPSDNKCKSFGGCAVPISAYQLYPEDGVMALYKFDKKPDGSGYISVQLMDHTGTNPLTLQFKKGQSVHDVAYQAYTAAMEAMKKPYAPNPPDNNLRLVFPPST